MQQKITHILLAIGMLTVSACNNAENAKTKDMVDSVTAKVDTAVNKIKEGAKEAVAKAENSMGTNSDSSFVVKAGIDNNKELRLLQEGLASGTDKELKAHARMMIADHKKLGAKMKAYASHKGYILVDGDNGKADDELATLNKKTKGKDWDKEWVDALTSGHKDAVDLFENNKDHVKDPELNAIIVGALPTLHEHLDMMKQMQDRMSK